MSSLWAKTVQIAPFPALEGDISTDVLIIGGGMAGLLCAYMLDRAGADYLLVEENTVGSGVTGCTTAKLTAQHGLIYHKLIKSLGEEKAAQYLQVNLAALDTYGKLCSEMDCDYSVQTNWVYEQWDRELLVKELTALKQLGYPGIYRRQPGVPVEAVGGIGFPRQGQFHPLKFMAELSRGLRIYEHSPVLELAPHSARLPGATVKAKRIVVATHFPMLNKHGLYFLKLYQHRSYCIALENTMGLKGMYVDNSHSGLSFRGCGELLILGGGGHRTGKRGGGWQVLEDFASQHYPGSRIRHRWATQDCMTLDGMPYIGRYSSRTEGLYVATGFNKWGMTGSMVAARLLRDLLAGKPNAAEALFSPSRSMLQPQLLKNAGEATLNLLTPSFRRCPHMGCALKWNPREHSWDCPCHGSRFDREGKRLDGPATGSIKK